MVDHRCDALQPAQASARVGAEQIRRNTERLEYAADVSHDVDVDAQLGFRTSIHYLSRGSH